MGQILTGMSWGIGPRHALGSTVKVQTGGSSRVTLRMFKGEDVTPMAVRLGMGYIWMYQYDGLSMTYAGDV